MVQLKQRNYVKLITNSSSVTRKLDLSTPLKLHTAALRPGQVIWVNCMVMLYKVSWSKPHKVQNLDFIPHECITNTLKQKLRLYTGACRLDEVDLRRPSSSNTLRCHLKQAKIIPKLKHIRLLIQANQSLVQKNLSTCQKESGKVHAMPYTWVKKYLYEYYQEWTLGIINCKSS